MWRLLFDIARFNQFAVDALITDDTASRPVRSHSIKRGVSTDETIGQYLEREGYSDAFRDDYLIPMSAAVWITSLDKDLLEIPAVTLIRLLYVQPFITS